MSRAVSEVSDDLKGEVCDLRVLYGWHAALPEIAGAHRALPPLRAAGYVVNASIAPKEFQAPAVSPRR